MIEPGEVYLAGLVATQEPLFTIELAHQTAHWVLGVTLVQFLSYLGSPWRICWSNVLRAILRTSARIDALRNEMMRGGGR